MKGMGEGKMKKIIACIFILGIILGYSMRSGAEELPFLEKQESQVIKSNGFGDKMTITKWYDNQNGYCVYTMTFNGDVAISVVKP
jgi:hypothetical protein